MARPAAVKDWQAIAKAAIAYKDVVKRHNEDLRRRVKTLESMVEAMSSFIEEHFSEIQ